MTNLPISNKQKIQKMLKNQCTVTELKYWSRILGKKDFTPKDLTVIGQRCKVTECV